MEENNFVQPDAGTPVTPAEPVAPVAPVAEQPVYTAPVEATPVAPVAEQPVYTAPVEATPVAPVAEQPVYTAPVEATPVAPVAEQPVYTAPVEATPVAPVAEQPVYTQPVAPAPVQPKKSKKGLIIGIIVVVVLAALAVGGFFLFKNLFATPKQKIEKAMTKLHTELAERPHPVLDQVGLADMCKYYETNPVDFDSSINVKIPELEDEMFDTFGIDLAAKMDEKQENFSLDLGVSVSRVDLLKLKTVFVDNTLYFALPGLLDDNYSFKFDEAESFLKKIGMDEYELTEFDAIMAQFETMEPDEAAVKAFEDGFKELQEQYKKEFDKTTKYTKGKNTISVTVSADTVNDYADDVLDYVLESDLYNDAIDKMLEQNYSRYSGYYEEDEIKDLIKEEKEDFEKEIREGFKGSLKDDVEVVFTFDKKGRIVRIETPEMIRFKSDMITGFGIDLSFEGDKYVTDKIEGSIKIQIAGERKQVIELGVERKVEQDKEKFTETNTLKFVNNGDSLGKIKSEIEWTIKEKEFNEKTVLTIAGQELVKITSQGALSDIKKGQSVKIDLAKTNVSVMGENLITISGSVKIAPVTEAIEGLPKAKEITEMDEDDLQEIIEELEDSLDDLEDLLDF